MKAAIVSVQRRRSSIEVRAAEGVTILPQPGPVQTGGVWQVITVECVATSDTTSC
jgi:hypothetical protein